MSESKQSGRCQKEVDDCYGSPCELVIADAIDRLAADVASIKAKIDAVAPEDVRHFVDSEKAWVKLVEDQRDAAMRERNEARAEVERLRQSRDAADRLNGATLDEVERLRAELAAQQAADVQPIGWIARHNHAPPVGKYVMCRWDVEARQGYARQVSYGAAKRGPDGMWLSPTGVEKIAPMHWMPLPPGVEGGDEWEQQPPAAPQPAGQGISPGLLETQPAGNAAPPAGWLTERERTILELIAMERRTEDLHWFNDVVPAIRSILFRAGSPPPQTAPWWLTDEERAEIKHLLLIQRHNTGWTTERHAELDALLARAGSPPVVEVPELGFLGPMTGREQGIVLAYRDALDKAGVPWKEVGRE